MKTSSRTKLILLSILLLPSLIYFFFELTQANFKKMAFYGPRKFDAALNDTIYYTVPLNGFLDSTGREFIPDTINYPVFLIGFLNEKYRAEGYKLEGLLDYTQFNPNKLNLITTFLVSSSSAGNFPARKKELKISNKDLNELYIPAEKFDSINNLFFNGKPDHVFPYFFALIDKKRHIRGYYDPSFVSEMKRMIQEFEHLKLRDEKANLEKKMKIEQKSE
jgi:hypothetical protein